MAKGPTLDFMLGEPPVPANSGSPRQTGSLPPTFTNSGSPRQTGSLPPTFTNSGSPRQTGIADVNFIPPVSGGMGCRKRIQNRAHGHQSCSGSRVKGR